MAPQRQPPVSRAGIASLLSGFARAYFSRIEQNFGGRARGARKRGIATAHERGCKRAFAQDLELRGQGVGVFHAQALQKRAEPEAARLLELDGDARRGMPG